MQPSADNRTGYVVDLAGNIYELLQPHAPSVPAPTLLPVFAFVLSLPLRSVSLTTGPLVSRRGEVTRV